MRFIALFIFFLGISILGFSQRFVEPDKMKSFNVTVNYPDYTVKTQMLKDPKKFTPDVDLTYHWYTAQKIMETKGGFDGKLLHGYYKSFYLTDQLFESGEFKYGVKTGEWKNWFPDGKIKEITNWKNGKKNGEYQLYTDLGVLMATGKFKNDELTGQFKTYDNFGKVTSVRKYKNGKEIIKKEKIKKEASTSSANKKSKDNPENSTEPKKEKKKLFKEKKPFGQKIKSIFKRKPKKETSTGSVTKTINT